MTDDEQLMRRCLELGALALERGDAPVGSLVVRSGEIIADGIESVRSKNDPTAHAEIVAIRSACEKLATLDLSDFDLITNVEPCWMCSYAIRQTRIARVVFGSRNREVGGHSSSYQILGDGKLKQPLPQIQFGVLQDECDQLLAEFQQSRGTTR